MSSKEQFSGRWALILASLGMAIGAGNLWRFPRLAGQYGGTFLILWLFFLIVWSVPLLMAEFSIGKKYKKGVIGSFALFAGKRMAWGGWFITVCTLGIGFYYSVVTGWGLRYLWLATQNMFAAIGGGTRIKEHLETNPDYLNQFWSSVSNESVGTLVLHIVAVALGAIVLLKGIQKGLEKANRILIPGLFILLFIIMVISLSMENGYLGLEYMFSIKPELFSNPKVWLEALSQSAWSTGAGWGLIMTISSYSRKKEDVTLNTFIGAFGNNTASLLAGLAILPSVFALSGSEGAAIEFLQSGNQALTFTIIPKLFAGFPVGWLFTFVFFLAFFMAAFSSLLPMIELFIKNLTDMGWARNTATLRAAAFCVIFGIPSAWSLDIFSNQDWVWGLGLIISGLIIMLSVILHGPLKFKKNFIDADSDFIVSPIYFVTFMFVNIGLGSFLIYWWMSLGYSEYPWFNSEGNWNVFDSYSNATLITQWLIVIVSGIVLNKWLYKTFTK